MAKFWRMGQPLEVNLLQILDLLGQPLGYIVDILVEVVVVVVDAGFVLSLVVDRN